LLKKSFLGGHQKFGVEKGIFETDEGMLMALVRKNIVHSECKMMLSQAIQGTKWRSESQNNVYLPG
jgi:hypothetical protein